MIKICSVCWESECKCGGRGYVDIDDTILSVIVGLNKKGYRTWSCCGGHISPTLPLNLYVAFNPKVEFESLPSEKWEIKHMSSSTFLSFQPIKVKKDWEKYKENGILNRVLMYEELKAERNNLIEWERNL